jgi:hypothetical protein
VLLDGLLAYMSTEPLAELRDEVRINWLDANRFLEDDDAAAFVSPVQRFTGTLAMLAQAGRQHTLRDIFTAQTAGGSSAALEPWESVFRAAKEQLEKARALEEGTGKRG